jgi:cold shock CspA family protein
LCNRNKGFENLAAGQKVTVRYHEREGRLFADAIDIAPILLACYNQ